MRRIKFQFPDGFKPPTPGKELLMTPGVLVESTPGFGLKDGTGHLGVPIRVGPTTTLLRRLNDGVELRVPNEELRVWNCDFITEGHRHQIYNLFAEPGWEWLDWSVADHVAFDFKTEDDERDIVPVQDNSIEPLVIVPCGAKKQTFATTAAKMYKGSYSALCMKAARAITSEENIRILSGKHGLLKLDEVIEPYEQRIGKKGSVGVDEVLAQAEAEGLVGHPRVIVLAGKDYARIVQLVWPDAESPLSGTKSIFEQNHLLAKMAAVTPDMPSVEQPEPPSDDEVLASLAEDLGSRIVFDIRQVGDMWFAVPHWSTGDPEVGFPATSREMAEAAAVEMADGDFSHYQIADITEYRKKVKL